MTVEKNQKLELLFLTDEELAEQVRQVKRTDPAYWTFAVEANRRVIDMQARRELLLAALENMQTGRGKHRPSDQKGGVAPKAESGVPRCPSSRLKGTHPSKEKEPAHIDCGESTKMNVQSLGSIVFIAVLAVIVVAQQFWA